MYIGSFIQEVCWINASTKNSSAVNFTKKYTLFSLRGVEKDAVKY